MIHSAKNIGIPYVLDNADDKRVWDLWSRLNKDRIVFIGEEIGTHMANIVVGQLLYLESQNKEEDIYMYINSPGGLITAGMAIYDTMNYVTPDVQTICLGHAASMAAFLLSAGTKGKRFCLPNAEVMIHQPLGGATGQVTDIMIHANHIERIKKNLNTLMAKHTGQTYEIICKDTERDNYMTAEEAVEYGLVDGILKNR